MAITVTAKALINTQYAPNSSSSPVYTSPTSTRTIIDKFTATEVAGNTPTITVWIVPSSGSVDDEYKVIETESMTANTASELEELKGHILEAGDKIYALSSAADEISIRCSGREVATS